MSTTKRFSLGSSSSRSRASVHFDIDTLISHPETIDSALKKRLSHMPYPFSSETRREDHESRRRRHSIVASYPKIDPSPKKDSSRSRRRQSIVLSPTKHPSPHIDSDPSRSRRRHSIVLSPTKHSWVAPSPHIHSSALPSRDHSPHRPKLPLFTAASVPDIHRVRSKSPRKRRFSTISPPPPRPDDSNTSTISPTKRRFSETKTPFSLTRKLCTIPPSTNKPPAQVCAEINQRIRSTFHYPDFDFIQHVQHRSYIVRTQHFRKQSSECVTMLDTGVDELLQRMFEKMPTPPDTNQNIDIRASPGKGLGMFSRKLISKGDVFFIEYPTVITPYVIGLSIGLPELYADVFGKLSGPVLGELMDLSPSSSFSSKTGDIHEAIMRINALAIELPVPDGQFSELNTHRAIFLQTSRCNHSCEPNARWEWDLQRFSLVLTAIRPIEEGEEITIPYVAPELTSKERQDILSNFYGFKCLCPLCDIPKTKINSEESIIPQRSSSSSLPSFEKWCLDPTFPDDILINSHKRAIEDNNNISNGNDDDDERDIGKHLDAIAMCYGALEDVDNFRTWMERVSEVRCRVKPEQKDVFRKWISNPCKFPVWGWRKVFCGEELGEEEESDGGGGSDELSSCVSMGMFGG